MVYMKWTIVMLPISFKNLKWFNFFFATFFFFLSFSVGKRSILAKILWGRLDNQSYHLIKTDTLVFAGFSENLKLVLDYNMDEKSE